MNPFKKMQIVPSGPLGGITKNKVKQLELMNQNVKELD